MKYNILDKIIVVNTAILKYFKFIRRLFSMSRLSRKFNFGPSGFLDTYTIIDKMWHKNYSTLCSDWLELKLLVPNSAVMFGPCVSFTNFFPLCLKFVLHPTKFPRLCLVKVA